MRQDNQTASGLVSRLEKDLQFCEDLEVSVYLRRVAQALADGTQALKASPVGVFVIRDSSGSWRNYSLPGNRIYVSSGLLRQLEFENEIAGALAFEFAHILGRLAVRRIPPAGEDSTISGQTSLGGLPGRDSSNMQAPAGIPLLGPTGVLVFSQEDLLKSAEVAVGILYRAGYDPRGLGTLWSKYMAVGNRSPFDPLTLERLADRTRQAITLYSPLRNPIVRSEEFFKIRKRIQRL